MWFLNIIFFFYILRPLTQKDNRYGLDEHLVCSIHTIKHDNETIKQLINIQEKKDMLDFLKSNHTSIDTKLYAIGDKNMPTIINIFNGGLLDDWNFEIFM